MKKVLLATSVLALSATVAAAEVKLSGDARMGVVYDGNLAVNKLQLTSRARVSFTMSGETDGGLAFGASFRADQAAVANGNTAMNGGSVFVSGAFGKLTMGDTGSAADNIVGNVSATSLTGIGDVNELGYAGNVKTAAKYEFSTNGLTLAISAGQAGSKDMSIAAKYSVDAYSVALGYEDIGAGNTQTTLGVGAKMSGVDVKLVVANRSAARVAALGGTIKKTGVALSVGYTMDATSVTAFYAKNNKNGRDAYGIGASYDLGGGAKVVGGISKESTRKAQADLGLSFSF